MSSGNQEFDVIVVGAGLMGSAAAFHLVEMGVKVALVGPSEPEEKSVHSGVFASHYDQARITRRLDTDRDWSRFASASIARYGEIARKGTQEFYTPVGSLIAGPEHGDGSDFIRQMEAVGISENISYEAIRSVALHEKFPFLDFPSGILALFESKDAGWVNPRSYVLAQINAACKMGVYLHRGEAIDIEQNSDGVVVKCADNTTFRAQKVVVACGAFSKSARLLPEPLPIKVFARTITFFEVADQESERLQTMPSTIYQPPDLSYDFYILPPVQYPDGKTYLKIGGDPDDIELETTNDMKEWFHGNGDQKVGEFLAHHLLRLMPELNYRSISHASCVTSYTKSGKPLIYSQTDRISVLTGGNGAGAKCADELGRVGAMHVTGDKLPDDLYETSFQP